MPELIRGANIAEEYVDLIAARVNNRRERGWSRATPWIERVSRSRAGLGARRALAAELFHGPGEATERAIHELYALMDLDVPARLQPVAAGRPLMACGRARLVPVTDMRLDVVIPTYNRAALLTRALESLLAADRPDGLDVTVTVVDNRSTDNTRAVVESFMPRFGGSLQYVYEAKPGRSHALNAGIAATRGDLVGMIDDDEEVDRTWLTDDRDRHSRIRRQIS